MKSMLIIDGSDAIATLFSELFRRHGWELVFCADQDLALNRLVGVEHYDVVFLGNNVPAMAAVQLVRFIRALEHRRTTAVVMMTENAAVTQQAIAAGADEVLANPINPRALMSAVDKQVC
jgi:CheY-like chemotaxis protein